MIQLSVQLDRLEVNYSSDELTEKNLTKLRTQTKPRVDAC